MRRMIVAIVSLAFISAFAFAQAPPTAKPPAQPTTKAPGRPAAKTPAPKSPRRGASAAPDKALLNEVLDGWASLNPDNVAKYYDQAPADVFYDVSPLKYMGFAQYAEGSKPMFATLSSLKFTLNDDATIHRAGAFAWSTATVPVVMTDKAGKTTNLECRWTAVWQQKAGSWVIVHDHFSAPMEAPKQQ